MAEIFGSKVFFDTPHFFSSKIRKKSIFWYSISVKKIRFRGGNSILNYLVETISSFRPVSKKRPETVWNCQSFTETGWKKKGLFGIKQGKRTVSSETSFILQKQPIFTEKRSEKYLWNLDIW